MEVRTTLSKSSHVQENDTEVDFAAKEISEDVGRIELFQNKGSNRL